MIIWVEKYGTWNCTYSSKIIIEKTVNVFNSIIKDAKVVNNNLIQNCIKEIF